MIPLPQFPMPDLIEATGPARERALALAPQAEWGLAHQGARVLLTRDRRSGWLVRQAGGRLVALGRPHGPPALAELARAARAEGLAPLLYKCDARTALAARRRGWSVLRLGEEAVLDLDRWSAERPGARQLRRKLRGAAQAGVTIEEAADLPLAAMEEVAQDWLGRAGRERGFSMGRFEPSLLGRQRVLLAWRDGRLIAFASFHATRREWALDLMRQRGEAPDGTMHRLVVEAARMARGEGVRRLSLAAIPAPVRGGAALRALGLDCPGLAQFKRAFGPALRPLYAAAPGPLGLAAGLSTVAWAVRHPAPLAPPPEPRRGGETAPHFAFEPVAVPCDAGPAQQRTAARRSRAAPLGPGDPRA